MLLSLIVEFYFLLYSRVLTGVWERGSITGVVIRVFVVYSVFFNFVRSVMIRFCKSRWEFVRGWGIGVCLRSYVCKV